MVDLFIDLFRNNLFFEKGEGGPLNKFNHIIYQSHNGNEHFLLGGRGGQSIQGNKRFQIENLVNFSMNTSMNTLFLEANIWEIRNLFIFMSKHRGLLFFL